MHDGEDAMPLDNTHLNQRSADIWADEHHHGVVLHKVPDGKPERVEHGILAHAVPVSACENDGLRLHFASLLVASAAGKTSTSPVLRRRGFKPELDLWGLISVAWLLFVLVRALRLGEMTH